MEWGCTISIHFVSHVSDSTLRIQAGNFILKWYWQYSHSIPFGDMKPTGLKVDIVERDVR